MPANCGELVKYREIPRSVKYEIEIRNTSKYMKYLGGGISEIIFRQWLPDIGDSVGGAHKLNIDTNTVLPGSDLICGSKCRDNYRSICSTWNILIILLVVILLFTIRANEDRTLVSRKY
mgnify:CR=1 FL=1